MTRAETIEILEKRCGKPIIGKDYYPVYFGYMGNNIVKYKVFQHGILYTQIFGDIKEYIPFNKLKMDSLTSFYERLVDLKERCKRTDCIECMAKQWCDVFLGNPCDWKLEEIPEEYR